MSCLDEFESGNKNEEDYNNACFVNNKSLLNKFVELSPKKPSPELFKNMTEDAVQKYNILSCNLEELLYKLDSCPAFDTRNLPKKQVIVCSVSNSNFLQRRASRLKQSSTA